VCVLESEKQKKREKSGWNVVFHHYLFLRGLFLLILLFLKLGNPRIEIGFSATRACVFFLIVLLLFRKATGYVQ